MLLRSIAILAVLLALPVSAQNWQASPRYEAVAGLTGLSPNPYSVSVVAGGQDANPVEGEGCVGYIAASRPDVTLNYNADRGPLNLGIYVESESDTALLIRGPDGRWGCDDDSGDGLNPYFLLGSPLSGEYAVWVATFGTEVADATLYFTERLALGDASDYVLDEETPASDEPNWRADPLYSDVVLQTGFTPDPYEVRVLAGGTVPNPIDGVGCVGYIAASQPDVNLTYSAGTVWDLGFYVESGSDTALLIRAPDGSWHCNDDSDGLDPRYTFDLPLSGTYNVWVATFGESANDAVLHITEVPRSSVAPDHRALPARGRITLRSGFTPDPYAVDVTAGGPDSNPLDGPGCVGYIQASRPDLVVDYTNQSDVFDLYFNVDSDSDTALLVRTPDGRWICNDDGGEGLNPRLHVPDPESGAYAVWVGTFGAAVDDAELRISELDR